jgi:hypothetical protein
MENKTKNTILKEVLSLNITERLFLMNKIYESLILDLPKNQEDIDNSVPEWLRDNLDFQTKEFNLGKLKTYSLDEVLFSVQECKNLINSKR